MTSKSRSRFHLPNDGHSRDTLLRFNSVPWTEEGIMGVVMIACPATGREVSTGIEMSGVDQLPPVIATMSCSACGGVHQWTKNDARLASGGEQYRQAALAKTAA